MRCLLFFVVLPFFTAGQTVHVEDNRILYKGTFKLEKTNRADVYARAKLAIAHYVNDQIERENDKEDTTLMSAGSIRLNSPYHLIKTLHYTIALTADDGKCRYRVDSVYVTQKERGGDSRKFSSEELLKGMDSTGPVAANVEKELNEIDMKFQKLIDLIRSDLKNTAQ